MAADKTYKYKVYDDNVYQGLLENVISPFAYSHELNTSGSELRIQIGKSFADVGAAQDNDYLVDEAGNYIVDENANNIVTQKDFVFNDIPIALGNRVKVYMYDSDNPNGIVVFDGLISQWRTSYSADTIEVTVLSWGVQAENYIVASEDLTKTVAQESYDTEHQLNPQMGKSITTNHVAQTFNLATDQTIGSIQVYMRNSSSTDPVNVSWSLRSGTPSSPGSILASGSVSFFNTSIEAISLQFPSALDLSSGDYFVDLYNSGGGTSGWGTPFVSSQSSNPYADGALYTSPTGSSYSSTSQDMAFVVNTTDGGNSLALSSIDPGSIIRRMVTQLNSQGGLPNYTNSTVELSGKTENYTLKVATVQDGIRKAYDLSPSGWYWYFDLTTNLYHYHKIANAADHLLTLGKHFDDVDVNYSLEKMINLVHFSGGDTGAGENLYSVYENANSREKYGQWLNKYSDNRVTLQSTADTIGSGLVAKNSSPEFEMEVIIDAAVYDIESFTLGEVVQLLNFSDIFDQLLQQIVRIDREDNKVRLSLGSLPPRTSSAIEDARRRLNALETIDNADTPS